MMFVAHFNEVTPIKMLTTHLMSLRHGDHEFLEVYTKKFNNEAMLVEDFTD